MNTPNFIDEVYEYVKSILPDVEIQRNSSKAADMSFDIFLPLLNVGIECHSLDWNDDSICNMAAFSKDVPRKKYLACKATETRLLQFFSDEWTEHNSTVKSIIANALGASKLQLHGRDCTFVELTPMESRDFLNANHVSSATRAKKHFGLKHPVHGLVSVATVRVPIQKKHGRVIELARMASIAGANIRGGASKLLTGVKAWAESERYEGLLSYAELRYGEGHVYEKCGLTLSSTALNNYWYTDGKVRFNRFKYRAQKGEGKTERDVALENNVRPVFGCGNNIYLVKFDVQISDLTPPMMSVADKAALDAVTKLIKSGKCFVDSSGEVVMKV